jgi:hypothetical protein
MPQPLTGQAVATGASNAVPVVPSPVPCTAFTIKAPLSNLAGVFIGPASVTSSTGYQLDPGDVFQYERLSQNGQPSYELKPSDFFVAGNSGDRVTWLASP